MLRPFITLLLILIAQIALADGWVRGSLLLLEVEGDLILSELGADRLSVGAEEAPKPFNGLLNCEAEPAARAVFSTSNRMFLGFSGEGSFSIERFEQILPTVDAWQGSDQETSQSRMIYNFRSGQLTVDSRRMDDASQCLIETPLGKITLSDAFLLAEIRFDQRSQLFNFAVSCIKGRVRFIDNDGVSYTLRNGQRIAGVGARTTPSIEVGELTTRVRDRVADFLEAVERNADYADDFAAYQGLLQPIRGLVNTATARKLEITPKSDRRPIVIERAKPEAVTPFRGEIPPPSAYQADLF